jgi:hypothetical protein
MSLSKIAFLSKPNQKAKIMNTLKLTLIGASLALTAPEAMAGQVGVVGLYENGTTINEPAVAALGCSVKREGFIVAAQGDLSPPMPQPDQFVVLDCDRPVLAAADQRSSMSTLFTDGEAIAVFEGALTEFQTADDTTDVSQRQYILKLGYYNNADTDGREADLTALDVKASSLDGHWTNEAYLDVHSAIGMPTPDEVVVIHYENAGIAEKFRDLNSDILQDVGTFNDAHLTSFTYLVGAATR